MLHTEVLPKHSLELLRKLSPLLAGEGFYLAGGTALALRLGHRVSVDLDFFSEEAFEPEAMRLLIEGVVEGSPKVVQQTSGSICFVMEETKVELFHYPYPLLAEVETMDGVALATLDDIGAMKLSAVSNRGAKKDFIDIAALLEEGSLGDLLAAHERKFPRTDLFTVVKSITWFKDADAEPEPKLLQGQSWDSVKSAIVMAAAKEAG